MDVYFYKKDITNNVLYIYVVQVGLMGGGLDIDRLLFCAFISGYCSQTHDHCILN